MASPSCPSPWQARPGAAGRVCRGRAPRWSPGRLLPALGLAALALRGTGCQEGPSEPDRAADLRTKVPVVAPVLRDLSCTVSQPGYVEAYEQTSIYSRVSGFIESFAADIGQRVKKGEVLAEIFLPELEEELRRKQAHVELDRQSVARADALVHVAENNLQTRRAQLAEAHATVGRFQAEVVRWESESTRLADLVAQRVVDRQALDESQKQLDAAKSQRDAAQAAVAAQEAETLAADADVAKARIDVRVAQAQVQVAEADARQTAVMLAYAHITAPYDAVITARNANTGDYVEAVSGDKSIARGSPLFVVARTDLFRLFIEVPESYAQYVHSGTGAAVRADALPGGEISAPIARTSWSLNEKSRTLRAEIDLASADYAGLRPGMYFHGSILIRLRGVRALPQKAIQTRASETYCYLVEDNVAVRVPIHSGLSDGTWVHVLRKKTHGAWSAFTGDEQVIVGDLTELTDGQRVEIARDASPQTSPQAPPTAP